MSLRKMFVCSSVLGLTSALFLGSASAEEAKAPPAKVDVKAADRPRVEVVFCLDTTGSMAGLIDAAKKKIWAISNQIASGKPAPQVKVGLVAYRDRGDAYVTQVFNLTEDLDSIYTQLMGFRADGGGDGPESVNQALYDAVHKIAWSKDKKVLRMIFLVGDAPPHMDYPDDVKYPDTCKEAVKRDIIVNTVLCGGDTTAKDHWVKMCRSAEGSFVQIDAGGGPIVAVATPFDGELAKINHKISETTLVFGDADKQRKDLSVSKKNADLKAEEAANRVGFYAGSGRGTSYDLLQNIQDGKIKLETLKKEELPVQLQGKSIEVQKAILETLDTERKALNTTAVELGRKRSEYINKKQAEDEKLRPVDSFDNQVLGILRTQAIRVNIEYVAPPGAKK